MSYALCDPKFECHTQAFDPELLKIFHLYFPLVSGFFRRFLN